MILFALIAWPILILVLARLLPWPNAVIASIIGGYLLLPEQGGINLPLLPPFKKDTIPCLTLFVLALLMRPGQQVGFRGHMPAPAIDVRDGWLPRSTVGLGLLGLIVAGSILTALTNRDSLNFAAGVSIKGLTLYDGFSIIVTSAALIVPVLLGRKYLAHPNTHRLLLWVLVIAGLAYSFLALVEIRLSPQMNRWVYGFFPHNWHMHVRPGGWRPLVFLNHGLWLACFFAMTIVAAFGLSRVEPAARSRWLLAGGWLLLTLALSNSLGALLIALFLIPVVLFLNIRLQVLLAGCIAGVVLIYPLLRSADLVPTGLMVSLAEEISEQRARSLEFRFDNEDLLLERANERPVFGWGPFGRNRVYDELGRDQSVVDGAWIVAIGQGGWIGYIGRFGLLTLPIILLALRRRSYGIEIATAVLCLVLVANVIDMIPNGTQSPITWLIVGALLGRLELGHQSNSVADRAAPSPGFEEAEPAFAQRPVSPYTRQSVQHRRMHPSRNT